MTISKKLIKHRIQKSKTYKKRASRTQPVEQVASTLKPGDTFRYKDYRCTVACVTKGLVYFYGVRMEKYNRVKEAMILNIASFDCLYAERKIILTTKKTECDVALNEAVTA